MTASKSGENSVGVGSNENCNSDANENEEEESKASDCIGYESSKKVLILKSPMGAKSAQYNWPLKKGKGSLRRSEDKEDEAGEIIETIRWVCEDVQSIKDAMETSGVLSKYDPKSYDSMLELCKTYNKSVDAHLKDRNSTPSDSKLTRCSKLHLKHILQKCYNKSVIDPNELNNYEAFTPEVYGETSFELICQILDKLHPIGRENRFVDLGSGVGQVVLQVAALTNCSMSLGIEKANTPAKYAEQLKCHFIFWMNFHGKEVSPFKLMKGDFLNPLYYEEIKECSIIFVNNYVFGPIYDQRLKEIFSEMQDGSRIFSSKSFCPTNFRTNNRNLNDIGTIMHVSKMDPLKGSVSWTGRPVSYYLHVIDRAKLERYFQKTAARKGEKGSRRGGGVWTDASRGPSEDDDEMTSSPSGIHGRPPVSDKDNLPHRRFGRLSKQRGKRAKRNTKKSLQKRHNILGISSIEESDNFSSARLHNDDYEFDRIGTPPTDSNSSSPPHTSDNTGTPNRPIRAVVANAVAISEAQHEKSAIKKRGRKRLLISPSDMKIKGKLNTLAGLNISNHEEKKITNCKRSKISGLDLLHKTTMESINASEIDLAVPQGCVYERLTKNAPNKLIHEELPISINIEQNNPAQLPFSLQAHLERCKRQYLDFMRHMEDPVFRTRVEADITKEKQRNEELLKRERQLKSQIENLISDSLGLLKCRLNELGIQAKSPPEFIEKAKSIVCNHHELQRGKASLENEIRQLEAEQEKVIAAKEKELLEKIMKSGVSYGDAKAIIQKQIDGALNGFKGGNGHNADPKVAPFLNKLSDVTLTKCEQSLPLSTQIRKRPRDQINRQKDWPEKRHKPFSQVGTSGSSKETSPNKQANWSHPEVTKIEEKNPEILAKKIMEQGRSLEKSKSNEPIAILSPKHINNVCHAAQPGGVEVRKVETTDIHYSKTGRSTVDQQHSVPLNTTSSRNSVHQQSSTFANDQFMNHERSVSNSNVATHNRDRSSACSFPTDKSPTRSPLVDLPKVDLKLSMSTTSDPMAISIAAAMSSGGRHALPLSQSHKEPPLVLPPHPNSRSHSSEGHTEDMTFASTKVSSTPRAEQFEDRLKTIIHSVLAGDSDQREAAVSKSNQDIKPPLHIMPYASNSPPHSSSSHKPMFSPVKKELPTHLPLPPSGIIGGEKDGVANTSHSRPQATYASDNGQNLSQHVPPPAIQGGIHGNFSHPIHSAHKQSMSLSAEGESGTSMIKPSSAAYHPTHSMGRRSPLRTDGSGMVSRSTNDVIVSEIEKNMGPKFHPRSVEETNIRNRDFSHYSSQMSREDSQTSHNHPKLAHSNFSTSRVSQSFAQGPSDSSASSSRGGAPSMARMSQVIEDSIRGHMGDITSPAIRGPPKVESQSGSVEKDLGGLACPRTKSPPSVAPGYRKDEFSQGVSRAHRLPADGIEKRQNQMSIDYPTMEVPHSSRFGIDAEQFHHHHSLPYHEKRNTGDRHPHSSLGAQSNQSAQLSQAGPIPTHIGPRRSYGDPWQQPNNLAGKSNHPPEAHSGSSSLPYRFDNSGYPPPPPSHSSNRDVQGRTQNSRDPSQSPLPPRKRMTPPEHNHGGPQHHTQLPLKKQSFEASGMQQDSYERSKEQMHQNPHHQSVPSRHQSIAQNMTQSSRYSVTPYTTPHRSHQSNNHTNDQNKELIQHYSSQRSEVTITPTPPPPSTRAQNPNLSHTLPQMSIPQFAPDMAMAASNSAPPIKERGRHFDNSPSTVSSSSAWRGEPTYGNGIRHHPQSNASQHYEHPARSRSPHQLQPSPNKSNSSYPPSQYRRIVLSLIPPSSSMPHPGKQLPRSSDMDDQNNKKWQEEISTGFDRLVAYATEVDKRRKSCDSNSPGFNNERSPSNHTPNDGSTPPNASTPDNNKQIPSMLSRVAAPNEEPDQFDNRMSTLSMKFKRAPNYHRYPGPPLRSPTSSLSSGSRHFAASSIPRDHDLISPPSSMDNNAASRASLIASSRAPLPGENLPEHHFKKRYFAEHIEGKNIPGRESTIHGGSLHDIQTSSNPLSPKKRLSMLGSKSSLQTDNPSSFGQPFSRMENEDRNKSSSERVHNEDALESSSSKSVSGNDIDKRDFDTKQSTSGHSGGKDAYKSSREKGLNISDKPKP